MRARVRPVRVARNRRGGIGTDNYHGNVPLPVAPDRSDLGLELGIARRWHRDCLLGTGTVPADPRVEPEDDDAEALRIGVNVSAG